MFLLWYYVTLQKKKVCPGKRFKKFFPNVKLELILHNISCSAKEIPSFQNRKKVYRNFTTAAKNSIYEILLQSFILAKIGSTSIYGYWISSF